MRVARVSGLALLVSGLVAAVFVHDVALAGGGAAPRKPAPVAEASSDTAAAISPAAKLASHGLVIPPAIEDIELMCSLLIGCPNVPLPVPTKDFGECVRRFWGELSESGAVKFSLAIRECGLGATSCRQLSNCTLRGASPAACDGRATSSPSPVGVCDLSGRAITCWKGNIISVRDCPRGSEQCAIRQGQAACILGNCPATDGGTDMAPSCSPNGQRIMSCDQGKLLSLDCSAFGLDCVTDAKGRPACTAKSTKACDPSMPPRCDGEAYVGCLAGHEIRVDCAKSRMTCAAGKTGPSVVGGCAVPPVEGKRTCSADSAPSRCIGESVQYCGAGTIRRYECKSFGMTKCVGGPGQAHCE